MRIASVLTAVSLLMSGAEGPKWASVNNGIFLCKDCAGVHRGMGINVSFVRSVEMDAWNEVQLKCMTNGGNARVKEFFDRYELTELPLEERYETQAAEYNRMNVSAIKVVEGSCQ